MILKWSSVIHTPFWNDSWGNLSDSWNIPVVDLGFPIGGANSRHYVKLKELGSLGGVAGVPLDLLLHSEIILEWILVIHKPFWNDSQVNFVESWQINVNH